MRHGMSPEDARRIRLTGNQLKNEFLRKYTDQDLLNGSIKLVQPIKNGIPRTILIKAGKNWQFRLGKIHEVEDQVDQYMNGGKTIKYKLCTNLHDRILTESFLSKYAFSATLFAARNGINWQIFSSSEIIRIILDYCTIRVLDSGRIKLDYHDQHRTIKGIMTIEYRPEEHKRCWVFGAHGGGSGEKLRKILQDHLIYTELPL